MTELIIGEVNDDDDNDDRNEIGTFIFILDLSMWWAFIL